MNAKIFTILAATASAVTVSADDDRKSCFELPGVQKTCGSHCWPNCDTQNDGNHPVAMDYNHYLVIPEARSCYIDTIDYGRFDAFMSKNSLLNVTMDVYVFRNGLCQLEETGKVMEPGALQGDDYCQMFLSVDMGECNGCPDYTRRIEVYSNKDTGCGTEFVNDNNSNDDNDNGGGDDGNNDGGNNGGDNTSDNEDNTGTVPPIEDGASQMIMGSTAFAAAAIMTLY